MRPYLVNNRMRIALYAVVASAAAVAEALILYMIVRIATALAAGDDAVDISLGGFLELELSTRQLFASTLVILASLIGLTTAGAYLAARMSDVTLTNARLEVFRAFLGTTWEVQSQEREGHLQELLTTYAKKVASGSSVLADGIAGTLGFLAFLASALVISPIAAVTILVGVVVLYAALRPFTKLTRKRSSSNVTTNATYAVSLTEASSLARELRVFDVEAVVEADVRQQAERAGRLEFATRFLDRLTPALYQDSGLLLVIGGMAGAAAFSVGDLTALGAVVLLLVRALNKSQSVQAAIQQASEVAPYLEGLTEETARYRRSTTSFGTAALGPVESLACVEMTFGYDPDRPVLRDLDFTVRSGETIGVVGPSGSGKSTLVQVLLRLRDPTAGSFRVNGRPAVVYGASSWAEQVAFVPQDNLLMHGTVADNVRFHRTGISDERVEEACRRSHLHDEVMAMAAGYATVVGSGGHGISGGQRQRLGLARALAGQPSVVVLDEPTSALDMRSESLVQATLEEIHGEVTVFIVAHRMSTIQRCDRIMVLRDGCIEAFEDSDQLSRSNDFYQEVVRLSQAL